MTGAPRMGRILCGDGVPGNAASYFSAAHTSSWAISPFNSGAGCGGKSGRGPPVPVSAISICGATPAA